jgi:hypothetical protein
MIRELLIAAVALIITVTATAWLNGGPRLSVQQVEASLARWRLLPRLPVR